MRDAGLQGRPEYTSRYDAWLRWLDEQQVESIGMGWINLHNVEGSTLAEEWPFEIEQPIGPHVLDRFERTEGLPADLTPLYLTTADDVVQETAGRPGAEDPATIVLRRQRGCAGPSRRQHRVSPGSWVPVTETWMSGRSLMHWPSYWIARSRTSTSEYLPQIRNLAVEGFLTMA